MTAAKTSDGPTKWDESVLWQTLANCKKHDAHEVVTLLENWMPEIERILASGGTFPKDFTLHDDQHASRVAQRMAEIMPEETLSALSPYELAFLLLSAYLHDIGMTPEYREVSLHYQYLLIGDQGSLNDEEIQVLQRCLDDDQDGVTPPLCSGKPTPDDLSRANRLVAHYCRHRHNDWSAEWIRKNAPMTNNNTYVPLGTFADWVDELVRLCQSHHYGRS